MNTPRYASIDPGKHACSVALWSGRNLTWAGFVKNTTLDGTKKERSEQWGDMAICVKQAITNHTGLSSFFSKLILEVPQIYSGPKDEDPNDLIDLAGVLGAIVGSTGSVVAWSPSPRQWKGQAPKRVTKERVDSKLTNIEKQMIDWPSKSLMHNVYDAIHLGLVYLERNGLREIPLPDRYPNKA